LNFVDVREIARGGPVAGVLRSMEKRAAVELSHIDVDEAIDRRPLLPWLIALLGIVVVARCMSSFRRESLPVGLAGPGSRAAIDVATRTMIGEITPGDDSVPARSSQTRRGRCARPRR